MSKPKIAIITTVRNNADTILKTLASIHLQTYNAWEHIVKDAQSKDNTEKILRTNGKNLTLLTGPDQGIYDGLNLAAERVTAEWSIVIQSNDLFFNTTVLSDIVPYLTDDVDIVYGDIQNIHATGVAEIKKTKSIDQLWKGMIGSHQGMFIRTSLLKKFPYNLKWKVSSDYDFLWKCVTAGARFKQVPLIIATVDGRGLASNKIVENMKEKRDILSQYDKSILHRGFGEAEIIRVATTKLLKKILPSSLVKNFIAWRSSKNS